MFDVSKLAIIIVSTKSDSHLINPLLNDIRLSLFSQEPTFIIISGEGQYNDLSVALNKAITTALEMNCEYIFWAHPDMKFTQPNWHIPLIRILNKKPSVLKICASNPRDVIGNLRIDQEQSWMMRAEDFNKYEGLLFNEEFKRIGGFEDWYQSWQIITSGFLVLVTPESQVYHEGMQTRKLRDTVQEQEGNNGVYIRLTKTHQNPHQWKFFGLNLSRTKRLSAFNKICKQFPEFKVFEKDILQ